MFSGFDFICLFNLCLLLFRKFRFPKYRLGAKSLFENLYKEAAPIADSDF